METTAKLFADNLTHIRESRGFTQETLAERLGCSVVTISNYENGRRWPDAEVIDEICKALGVSPAMLLLAQSEIPQPTPEEALEVIAREIHKPKARILRAAEPGLPEEYSRVLERIKQLGPNGLRKLEKTLDIFESDESDQQESKQRPKSPK